MTHSGNTNDNTIAASTTIRFRRWKVSRLSSNLKKR
jgi:hypothetical protein